MVDISKVSGSGSAGNQKPVKESGGVLKAVLELIQDLSFGNMTSGGQLSRSGNLSFASMDAARGFSHA